jgi:thiol-disulfide isomerase/thioredoxin
MYPFHRIAAAGLLLALLLAVRGASAPDQPPAPDKVAVRVVNYAELGKTIRSLTGKVIVVDFWATNCVPCIQKFPHLVQMHNKYAKDGLAAVSVSLDPPSNANRRKRVDEFLTRQKATFTNLVLDAPPAEYQKKLRFDGPPCIYVFDRTNRIVGKYPINIEDGVDYAAVEKQVLDLLKK